MCLKKEFDVKVCKSEEVAPALPMQEYWLPLSNLDFLLPPIDFGVFFCYTYNESEQPFAQIVAVLKKALAQTLVSYYAFAGVLVENSAGEPELLCNNSGVEFIEAVSDDVGLEELNLYNPDESVSGKLVPLRKRGVLAVQVTKLKRGGMVVACTVCHQVADAYSTNMFLVSWAETARSKRLSPPPSFRRSLLLPRRPTHYDISVDNMYTTMSALPPPPSDNPEDDGEGAISRIYYVKSDQIQELQVLANTGNSKENRRSKLEAFSAFLWKTVVSGKESGGDNTCKLGIVVDGRSRLIDGDEERAKLIAPYFGNVLSVPFGEKKIEVLKEKSLNWVANEVHEFLHCAATKEHFVGLVDWVEEHRPEMAQAKICVARVTEEEPAVVVSSGQQFPARKMDFGLGLPVFGSYHFPWGSKSGYVMPMPSVKGNGDWIVYMHLLRGQLELIESNAAHVFNPITSDYVFS
ncbi:HXXXD-type acyl-transferase family protein [Perilla frutescens var. frutescens]|nr:HXXXD-type acyl-transferase family protein [Perilla frutescens var. frutescens]